MCCKRLTCCQYLPQSLRSLLRSGETLSWAVRVRIASEAAQGLNRLHLCTPPMLHKYFKSSDVLITKDLHVRVADFGMDKVKFDITSSFPAHHSVCALNQSA